MRTFLVTALAVCLLSTTASAIGPFSTRVGRPNGAAMYRANVHAIGGGHNYHPAANLGNVPAFGAGGMITPWGYQPWSYTVTPYGGGALYQGYGGFGMPGYYQPYSYGGFAPGYSYPGFGVY